MTRRLEAGQASSELALLLYSSFTPCRGFWLTCAAQTKSLGLYRFLAFVPVLSAVFGGLISQSSLLLFQK
jgi:hypothetical protein